MEKNNERATYEGNIYACYTLFIDGKPEVLLHCGEDEAIDYVAYVNSKLEIEEDPLTLEQWREFNLDINDPDFDPTIKENEDFETKRRTEFIEEDETSPSYLKCLELLSEFSKETSIEMCDSSMKEAEDKKDWDQVSFWIEVRKYISTTTL